ncbi:MAG: hypothetical protein WC443_09240 [Desulfobaccales bacterium]
MSKNRPSSDATQLSIFSILTQRMEPSTIEGQFKCVDRLRAAMRAALKGCPLSIHQLAGEMSHLLGTTITADQIYSWTRESDELNGRNARHIPGEYLPAFCHVTGSHEPLELLGRTAGVFVLPGVEALRAEIHRLEDEIRERQDRKNKRQAFLRELQKGGNQS